MTDFFHKEALKVIGNTLLAQKETLAVAESVTAGLLQAAFSTIPDASLFFQGGITVYNLDQKTRHLHIDAEHAMACNCVSEKVACELAMNVCTLFSCNWGIGVTGYASPVPESGNRLFAYFSIMIGNRIVSSGRLVPEKKDEPFQVQQWYANRVLDFFAGALR